MQNITIGRYKDAEAIATRVQYDDDGNETSRELFKAHAGWIEGTRDDGSTWIMFMDAAGSPQSFWAHREADGAVVGGPIELDV